MELEMGLKLTKTAEDFTSADLRISKDRGGPHFTSKETDSMFILTLHLKGYEIENIKIEINKDKTQITINGEKPVQEIVMVGWRVCEKENTTRRFRRGFKIPDGVVVDKINAWFNKEESILTIKMPKLVKGFRGIRVEEVREEKEVDNERIETSPIPQEDGKKPDIEGVKGSDYDQAAEEKKQTTEKESQEAVTERRILKRGEFEEPNRITETNESAKNVPDQLGKSQVEGQAADEIAGVKGEIQGQESEKQDKPQKLDEDETSRRKQLEDKDGKEVKGKERESGESSDREEERSHVSQANEASSEKCGPIIIGSAFLVSVIVFVIHLFRTRNPTTKRKN